MKIGELTLSKIKGLALPHETLDETVFRVLSELEKHSVEGE
jgi:hypothetical protein